MESPKNYRDNLVKKLKDIRSMGDHGKEAAKTILQGEQQTKQYQHAKNLHHEARDLEKVLNTIDQQINDLKSQIARLKQHKGNKIIQSVEKQLEYGSNPENIKFPIWKTIELSTKTPEQYTKELTNKGNQINIYAQQILNKIEPLKSPEQINLVVFSVEQLGFPNGATFEEIYDKARSMGLELCPPQVGPELRLSYTDQPNNECLLIAMDPIDDADGDPRRFVVSRNDSEPWLHDGSGDLGRRWNGSSRFVFRSST
jgi:hypothetical protein